jgi:hypothetical protein
MESKERNSELIKRDTIDLLRHHNISFENWGKDSFKTINHLVKEIVEGESILSIEDNELFRKISIVFIDVCYIDVAGKIFKLIEEKQIFKDGRERKREFKEEGSVAEKLKSGEIADENVVRRAVAEELGIKNITNIINTGTKEDIHESESYPGLKTKIIKHFFKVQLNKQQFVPEGYMERQPDKNTYFKWVK